MCACVSVERTSVCLLIIRSLRTLSTLSVCMASSVSAPKSQYSIYKLEEILCVGEQYHLNSSMYLDFSSRWIEVEWLYDDYHHIGKHAVNQLALTRYIYNLYHCMFVPFAYLYALHTCVHCARCTVCPEQTV